MNVIKQNVIEVSLPLPEYPVLADLMSTAPYKLSEKEEGVISTNWRASGGEALEEEEASDQQSISELDHSVVEIQNIWAASRVLYLCITRCE